VRRHRWPSCGLVEDRDVHAAKNIKQAGALPSGTANRWVAG
jgi:transposase